MRSVRLSQNQTLAAQGREEYDETQTNNKPIVCSAQGRQSWILFLFFTLFLLLLGPYETTCSAAWVLAILERLEENYIAGFRGSQHRQASHLFLSLSFRSFFFLLPPFCGSQSVSLPGSTFWLSVSCWSCDAASAFGRFWGHDTNILSFAPDQT